MYVILVYLFYFIIGSLVRIVSSTSFFNITKFFMYCLKTNLIYLSLASASDRIKAYTSHNVTKIKVEGSSPFARSKKCGFFTL